MRLARPRGSRRLATPDVRRARASSVGRAVPLGKMAAPVSLQLEFGGGAELLFDGIKKHQVTLPSQPEPWDVRRLLMWIKENLLKERPELFVQGDSVRPGILVLINDSDWELMGAASFPVSYSPRLHLLPGFSWIKNPPKETEK
uniref:Ubiquitin-related modifier 1 n=1 Tax=Anolis carolinensis TaxID=28377 RepID=A0A803TMF6_ANOCA